MRRAWALEILAAILGIQSYLVYLQPNIVLDKMRELSSRSEANWSNAIAFAYNRLWCCKLSRSILCKP